MKPITEIEAALERIGARHGLTLAQMKGRDRSEMAVDARRECYAYLRREKWSVLAIAAFFNRHERTVWQAVNPTQREARRGYMQNYMRDWRAKRAAAGQAT